LKYRICKRSTGAVWVLSNLCFKERLRRWQ
jgi:hypothetical protein